jgi:PAS domain S-box-containing protein
MEKDQLLQSILNSISEGVMALDKNWKVVLWNNAAERITGFLKEEVLGKECHNIFRSRLCGKHCLLDRALSCGHPCQEVEAAIYNRRHEVKHLIVNAAPLYDSHGDIIGGLETFRDVSQHRWMSEELENHLGYKDILGQSPPMIKVFEILASLVKTDTTVLIQGESGTGKELIARALHFVAINCSAIPEGMLESELFGHARGAFTGAVRTHIGKFELANGGTLFLDEIAEISPSVQVKLLRVLELREFQRLGDNASINVDVRVIAATNTNLYNRVLEGAFREDLYYRLSVFPLDLPPLRQRTDDIQLLVGHFIAKFNKHMGRKVRGISHEAQEMLAGYTWPGNVRELANAIEHAFVHCKGEIISPSDLPQRILTSPESICVRNDSGLAGVLESVERQFILKKLEACNWKKSLAAKQLGMSVTTLWRRMEKYGIGEPRHQS